MKRRRKSPADDLVHVSFCGLGIYRPGVSIAQWKWDISKRNSCWRYLQCLKDEGRPRVGRKCTGSCRGAERNAALYRTQSLR